MNAKSTTQISEDAIRRASHAMEAWELVGNTPLLRLRHIVARSSKVETYAQAEWFNPGEERKRTLKSYGAELVLTSPLEGSDGAIREARRLYAENPDLYFYPDQYNNEANWKAHYETTALEIWQQTEGRITHFIAGLGTSGTFVGTTRRLKELNPAIKAISFQPDSPFHGLEGLKHMETAIVPGIYDATLADETYEINTEQAHEYTRNLGKREGLLVGVSSGAALACALKVAEKIESGMIVTVFPDAGDKYLSERFWDEE